MKRILRLGFALILTAVFAFAFAACVEAETKLDTTYTVTFNTNGGNTVDAVTQLEGTEVAKPADPTQEKHDFAGWYYDAALQVSATFPFALDKDCTLYAKWEASTGTGIRTDPYLIRTKEQLIAFAEKVSSGENLAPFAELCADIDLDGMEWTPIGTGTSLSDPELLILLSFQGSFDGKGFTVRNFKITNAELSHAGLFGTNAGTIQNVGVENFVIDINSSAAVHAGGLAGYNTGSILDCHAIGQIMVICKPANSQVLGSSAGGLLGRSSSSSSTIVGCSAAVEINFTATATEAGTGYAGGLIGYKYSGDISDCYATGNITAASANRDIRVGGLIGTLSGTVTADSVVSDCYATGSIQVSPNGNRNSTVDACAGGLIGNHFSNTVSNSFATGNAVVNGIGQSNVGGLFGYRYPTASSVNNNCYRYTAQTVTGQIIDASGTICTVADLDNPAFYTGTLGWDPAIWDFSALDFASGKLPTLRKAVS